MPTKTIPQVQPLPNSAKPFIVQNPALNFESNISRTISPPKLNIQKNIIPPIAAKYIPSKLPDSIKLSSQPLQTQQNSPGLSYIQSKPIKQDYVLGLGAASNNIIPKSISAPNNISYKSNPLQPNIPQQNIVPSISLPYIKSDISKPVSIPTVNELKANPTQSPIPFNRPLSNPVSIPNYFTNKPVSPTSIKPLISEKVPQTLLPKYDIPKISQSVSLEPMQSKIPTPLASIIPNSSSSPPQSKLPKPLNPDRTADLNVPPSKRTPSPRPQPVWKSILTVSDL